MSKTNFSSHLQSVARAYRLWAHHNIDIAVLPLMMVAVVITFSLLTAGTRHFFLSGANLSTIAFQIPILGLLSLAMMITMLTGGINLATISTANFTAVIMALILTHLFPEDPSSISAFLLVLLTIIAGLAFSLLLGLINGMLIAYIGVSPVLATLGTMIFYEGLTLAITKGFVLSNFPAQFLIIGIGTIFNIPYTLLVFILVVAILSIVLRRRPFGKQLYMVGSNETATHFSGISIKKVLLKTYLLSGLLCGVAAVILVARFNSANARTGASFLLLTVLISVLGGTDPFGGFGKISGLVLALLTLQFLSSGLNLLGVTPFVAISLWGIILIGAIVYRFFRAKQREKESMGVA